MPDNPSFQPSNRSDKFIEPELIRIPAGYFLMGSDMTVDPKAQDDELPQHRLYLNEYWIGRYPVTNEEYRFFLLNPPQARIPDHWKGTNFPPVESLHPVVNVSWHDALAYCRWLESLTGRPYTLPSEAEWEKAARGPDGLVYPWGNRWLEDRCNTWESGIHHTTPVGKYAPLGDSPYGCADMSGNVWEWTRSLWGNNRESPDYRYPYNPGDGRENLKAPDSVSRWIRGGSWNNSRQFARCAERGFISAPSNIDLGFRVVVSPI